MDVNQAKLAAEADPNNGPLWLEYATALHESNSDNFQEIDSACKNAKRLIPGINLGCIVSQYFIRHNEYEKAVLVLEAELKTYPRSFTFCFLAYSYLMLKKNNETAQACRSALELEPDYAEAYYLLAESQREASKPAAIQFYKKAIGLDPDYELALQRLGSILISNRDTLDEGIAALKRAVALNETDVWAWLYLGIGFWKKRDTKAAQHAYEQAVKLAPDDPQVKKWYEEFMDDSHGAVPV